MQTSARRPNPRRPAKRGDYVMRVGGQWPRDAFRVWSFLPRTKQISLAQNMVVVDPNTQLQDVVPPEYWSEWRGVSEYEKLTAPWYRIAVKRDHAPGDGRFDGRYIEGWTQGEPTGWSGPDLAPLIRVLFDAEQLALALAALNHAQMLVMSWDDEEDAVTMQFAHLLSGSYQGFSFFYEPMHQSISVDLYAGSRFSASDVMEIGEWRAGIAEGRLSVGDVLDDVPEVITRHDEQHLALADGRSFGVWAVGQEDGAEGRWVSVEAAEAGMARRREAREREEYRQEHPVPPRPPGLPPGVEWPMPL